ncbi:LCP family protein [Oryzihumus leptocrescens]|uniref:LytR family transcriptional attenuator n=1 Tax=Oryzihumus leptocrescens TaxID=297536 RepID=A0A542Z969_9MICO|nr:LCP family protein [Oryzihumus leptocrescens]TQL56889.1 LytR family transcriptional attenuator [Oryzihumus leptocrescens]
MRAEGRRAHRHPLLRRGAIIGAALMAVVLVLGLLAYIKLNGNIHHLDLAGQLGSRPKAQATRDKQTDLPPMNILVMGSDTRNLGTNAFGTSAEVGGARSDTTLLVHLAADRKSAIVVSIPRDSMVKGPVSCKNKSNDMATWEVQQFNSFFSAGGPACTLRTVEQNTGIRIDHFMVINFLGFESMVDALGAVPVCVPQAVNDPLSGLKLPKGRSEVSGRQALAFVRARYTLGDGSDLSRIDRQQAFLSSMVQTATSSGTLLRPDKLFRFLDAATKSLTTDPGLGNLNSLREVAMSVQGLPSSQIRFLTVPVEPYTANQARVQWTDKASALWDAIAKDEPLPGTGKPPAGTPAPATSPTPAPTSEPLIVTPDKIHVSVINDSGVPGIARQDAGDLQLQGFQIEGFKTGSNRHSGVIVSYSPSKADSARTVAAAFPGAELRQDDLLGETIEVSVGTGSPQVVAVPNRIGTTPLPSRSAAATAPSATPTFKARAADADICSLH